MKVRLEDENEHEGADLGDEDDQSAQLLDRLCLALGLLTNLVQNVPESKALTRDTRMSFTLF